MFFPNSVCNALDRAVRNFFWNDLECPRKLHLIGWDTICSSKEKGGLGIPLFHAKNLAFLAKLCWRVNKFHSEPWARICNVRLNSNSGVPSTLGKCLKAGSDIVVKGFYKVINSRTNSLFWLDSWCNMKPLRNLVVGPLQNHESELKVKDVCVALRTWNCNSISFILPNDIYNMIRATPVNPSSNKNDSLVWKSSINGDFNLASAYALALHPRTKDNDNNSHPSSNSFNWIWKALCHVRRKFFIWKVAHSGIPVASCLAKRGLAVNSLWPLCGQQDEIIEHLFMKCSISRLVWESAAPLLNLNFSSDFNFWFKHNISSKLVSCSKIPHGTIFVFLLMEYLVYEELESLPKCPYLPFLGLSSCYVSIF